jgi:alpha-L-fucosidase
MKRRSFAGAALATILAAGVLPAFSATAHAQAPGDTRYEPSPANLEARQWFQNAKFGLFIHWGVYSVPGRGEWVMNVEKIPIAEYEKFAPQFNPTAFDAAAWVALAKAAGMKYITITSKHHDGFAMFDSKVSDWDIVERTPYGRDPLKMLADECHKQGIKLFFYYSQLDWHHPDYFPRGQTGQTAGRPESGDWDRYIAYMDAQLSELLTNYGEVGGIWFDGMWDKPNADWHLERTYALIHRLQPQALVGSNHHKVPFQGEDFQMFEKDLPGGKTSGFNPEQEVGNLPLETCETINNSWGYNAGDKSFKSTRDIIRYLVRAAGNDANFLLNIGPRPDGTIQPEFQARLREVGAWLAKYGDSVYGTRNGPVTPRPWGVSTRKGDKVYLHILEWPDETLALPAFEGTIKSAKFMKDGSPATITRDKEYGLLLKIPRAAVDEYDTVVEIDLGSRR